MNNKKGFTLLEVLAVIVVLAVIALITIPIVSNVMKNAKKNSFTTSMDNLVKSANNYYAENQLSIDSVMTFCFGLSGSGCTTEKLKYSGTTPNKGKLIINPDGEISLMDVSNGTYYANYDSSMDDAIVITEDNQVLNRDELTQAIKDLQKKLTDTETNLKAQITAANKKITDTEAALRAELAKKAAITELTKVQTQLTSTTTIANTANNTANSLNTGIINKTYPVGSIYISYSATNPASLFGGTWVSYGTGRTLVGVDTSNGNFNSVGKTGGSSSQSITLTAANLPWHTHSIPALSGSTNTAGNHTHDYPVFLRNYHAAPGNGNPDVAGNAYRDKENWVTAAAGNHSHTVTTNASTTGGSGSGSAFGVNTLNPYITVYMWRRTA